MSLAAAVSLTLLTSWARADTTPGQGFSGTGEAPRAISTATLPENAASMRMPVVRGFSDVAEIGREILSEDDLRARFGATTLEADGTVRRTPASDTLMRVILSAAPQSAPCRIPAAGWRLPSATGDCASAPG